MGATDTFLSNSNNLSHILRVMLQRNALYSYALWRAYQTGLLRFPIVMFVQTTS
jgi:hypothetical protein